MSFHARQSPQIGKHTGRAFRVREGLVKLGQLLYPAESADYRTWRHRFMVDRLRLFLWLALLCYLSFVIYDIYALFVQAETFNQHIAEELGNANLANAMRKLTIINDGIMGVLLLACTLFYRTRWGHRYPALVFLWVSWAVTLVPQIVGTLFSFPDTSQKIWVLVFLAQATLIPLRWQLHLLSQLGAIVYYIGLNPLLGLTEIQGKSIYDTGDFVYLFWVCLICNLAVYLYERLKRSEFESQRQLQALFHSVSHDLRTPVMGTSMVLKSLLHNSAPQVPVNRSVLERLLEGSDRQLTLINSLLEAHTSEIQPESLHCQPISLHELVDSVLFNLDHALLKHQVDLSNQISPDLPQVNADSSQLWRVFSNLIGNALKHNPDGIQLTLKAEVVEGQKTESRRPKEGRWQTANGKGQQQEKGWGNGRMVRCTIQDNGVGIPPEQCDRLFERYARGARARYMPGLGLGLYLCRQIIQAHSGQISVISTPGQGTLFWFTLPVVDQAKQR